ncbi:Protein arginine methyltransferase NDUFAF7 like, mitochondrial [Pseudolycoriella hygida]|uniref:Protein arginine methyltransferase NDUFAF7 n=1 Tax=Pseudolycoriella hygida TaxID=35572 RepID=A0A9Q0ML73_9DIPT|nr:Protein arginine methyltransferase NDUFAF7 like, mitochondrial [Pseudolycoriella hygida]
MSKQFLSSIFSFNQSFRRFSYKQVKRPSLNQLKDPNEKAANDKRPKPTLNEYLRAKISSIGPLTVAEYMKASLTYCDGGYYMNKDVFGRKGDFITSPEITQIFGELVAIWLLHEWQKVGSPSPLQIVELGPGRGTMMHDVIRVLSRFGLKDLLSVHLVEVSPHLSELQAKRLCQSSEPTKDERYYHMGETSSNIPVLWYKRIEDLPNGFSIVLAHEFFDALPIHKFQKTDGKWREILVDYNVDAKKYEFVVARKETPMLKLFLSHLDLDDEREHLEYSAEGHQILEHLSLRLEQFGGFSLVIDYGHDGTMTDTFRAFKNHEQRDPLMEPGSADLTANVDFKQMRKYVGKNDRMITFGPIKQLDFMKKLGGDVRIERLKESATPDLISQLQSGYDKLIDPNDMGSIYKVFSMFPSVLRKHLSKFPPTGFD